MDRDLSRTQKLRILVLAVVLSWLALILLVWLVFNAPGTFLALVILAVLVSVWNWRT